MFYCDSNLFISAILLADERGETATKILRALSDGKIKGLTSSLTLDEVLWVTWQNTTKDEALEATKRVMELSNLEIVDTRVLDIRRAMELIKKYDLKPRDAIHAACSLSHAIFSIISDDDDFDVVKGLKRLSFEDVVSTEKL